MAGESAIRLCDQPVAITGVGLATALGLTADATWAAVVAGGCGMGPMCEMESQLPSGSEGGQAPDLPADFAPELPREARYLRWTIVEALRDAGALDKLPADPDRCAWMLGTTLHGIRAGGRFFRSGEFAQLRDFLAGDTLRRAADDIGFTGPAATTCSACSSSLGSVALGITLLQTGQADLVVAGGYDTVSEYAWAGFNALRLISPGALRPFTKGRQGMKLGEGYGIVMLERADDAQRRGARTRAIVAGCGESADSHHLTRPHPDGQGALAAMNGALARAGIEPSQLDLVAAHATGTPDNDAAEHAALSNLLGQKLNDVPVVCFKSHLGHTLGGAGTAELILSALAIRDGIVPACANVEADQVEFPGLCVTTGAATHKPIRHTLNTSLGFGGANTCVVLRAPDEAASGGPHGSTAGLRRVAMAAPIRISPREVWITGIGVVMPGAVGSEALLRRLREPGPPAWRQPPAMLEESEYENLLSARRVRRMSAYVKHTLAAATLACRDAGIEDNAELLAETCALLGTTHGSSGFCYDYYAQLIREGVGAANPVLFAEGVPNVGAAQLSLMLGLKGACQSIIGSRTAGLDALRLAWLRIAGGEVERIVVGAGEESQSTVDKAYERCGLRSGDNAPSQPPFAEARGFCSAAGAVTLVLESAEAARARKSEPYARIEHAAALSGGREALPRTLGRLLAAAPPAPHLLCSANGTWIDRAELHALSRLPASPSIGNTYDTFGETFSAAPLLAIAAALVSGVAPALAAPPTTNGKGPHWAQRGERIGRFICLCTDWTGGAALATIRPMARTPAER